MPQNMKGSKNMSIRGEVEDTTRKEDDISKKQRRCNRKEQKTIDKMKLEDSEGEEKTPTK